MQTNSDIYQAFIDKINTEFGGDFSISYEGYSFTPPASGVWLELKHFPNTGVDQSLASNTVLAQGIFQVTAKSRKEKGIMHIQNTCDLVAAEFPKNTVIAGTCRVSAVPYQSSPLTEDDRISVGLTIPYSE